MINTRFFAFGCSFTNSIKPTWADIVAREYKYFENWGNAGSGNSFIFYSLMECHKRNKITKDDVVMIMWTNIGREDRFIKDRGWVAPGSIYNQTEYDENFVRKFSDPTGYLIRDMAHLTAARCLLDSVGCKYKFFSVVPFSVPDDNIFKVFSMDTKITNLYKDELASVAPSVYETLFNCDWYSRPGYRNLVRLEEEYNSLRGDSWPTWEEFTEQNFSHTDKHIINEINEQHNFSRRYLMRTDTHPVIAEYLEYLTLVAPDIELSNETREWVNETNIAVMAGTDLKRLWKPTQVRRFQ